MTDPFETRQAVRKQSDTIRSLLSMAGLRGFNIDCGVLVDGSRSMADEYGLDKNRQRVPGQFSMVQSIIELFLAIAMQLDPNRQAQGVFFSNRAKETELIDLSIIDGWVERNRLPADKMDRSFMAPGLQMMLGLIAEELGVPEIAHLAGFAHDEHHSLRPEHTILAKPYLLSIFTDGDPEDFYPVEALLRAMSYAPILVLLTYTSNQRAGLDVLKSLTRIKGRKFDNVQLVHVDPRELQGNRIEVVNSFVNAIVAGKAAMDQHELATV